MRKCAPTPHTSADCLPCCLGSECETGSRPGASPDPHCQPHSSPLPQNAIPALCALSTYAVLPSQARLGFNVRMPDRHGSNLRIWAILVSWLEWYTESNRLSRRNGIARCLDGDCSSNRAWLVPENSQRSPLSSLPSKADWVVVLRRRRIAMVYAHGGDGERGLKARRRAGRKRLRQVSPPPLNHLDWPRVRREASLNAACCLPAEPQILEPCDASHAANPHALPVWAGFESWKPA